MSLSISIVDFAIHKASKASNASRTRKEKFLDHNENCRKNVLDLEDSLVTSSSPPGQPQERPDDRTSKVAVVVRTADGSWRTTGAADEQCCEVWMKQSVM